MESRYQLGQAVDTFNLTQSNQTVYAGRSEGLVDGWTTRWTVGLSRDKHRVAPVPLCPHRLDARLRQNRIEFHGSSLNVLKRLACVPCRGRSAVWHAALPPAGASVRAPCLTVLPETTILQIE